MLDEAVVVEGFHSLLKVHAVYAGAATRLTLSHRPVWRRREPRAC